MLQTSRIHLESNVLNLLGSDRFAFDKLDPVLHKTDFNSISHGRLYELMFNLHKKNIDYNYLVLNEEYKKTYNVEAPGDLLEIITAPGLMTCLNQYARQLKEYSIKDKYEVVLKELLQKVKQPASSVDSLLNMMHTSINELELCRYNDNTIELKPRSSEIVEDIKVREKSKKNNTNYYNTKFNDLDKIITGFRKGDFVIIGARPSVGKTALAMNIALNMNCIADINVAFFSLEMSADSLVYRTLSCLSTIPHADLQYKVFDVDKHNYLDRVTGLMKEGFYINDKPNMDLDTLCSESRRLVRKNKVEVIFIDYLGLISYDYNKFMPRHEQVANVSKTLKDLARTLKVPIVALSQLNREVQDKEPNLFNIRESGALEQDADMVLLMHKIDNSEDNGNDGSRTIQINVAKNRNGNIGQCLLTFNNSILRFTNYKK